MLPDETVDIIAIDKQDLAKLIELAKERLTNRGYSTLDEDSTLKRAKILLGTDPVVKLRYYSDSIDILHDDQTVGFINTDRRSGVCGGRWAGSICIRKDSFDLLPEHHGGGNSLHWTFVPKGSAI